MQRNARGITTVGITTKIPIRVEQYGRSICGADPVGRAPALLYVMPRATPVFPVRPTACTARWDRTRTARTFLLGCSQRQRNERTLSVMHQEFSTPAIKTFPPRLRWLFFPTTPGLLLQQQQYILTSQRSNKATEKKLPSMRLSLAAALVFAAGAAASPITATRSTSAAANRKCITPPPPPFPPSLPPPSLLPLYPSTLSSCFPASPPSLVHANAHPYSLRSRQQRRTTLSRSRIRALIRIVLNLWHTERPVPAQFRRRRDRRGVLQHVQLRSRELRTGLVVLLRGMCRTTGYRHGYWNWCCDFYLP